MGTDRWWIDDFELTQGVVRDIETRSGMHQTPAPVGTNPLVPNRSGEVWVRKVHGAGTLTLSMWLGDGTIDVLEFWADVLRACTHVHRQLVIRRQMPSSGEMRECNAELSSSIQPTHLGEGGMRAQLEFKIPSGQWQSVAAYSHLTPAGAALPKTLVLNEFEHSTAPNLALVCHIPGPIINPRVTDITDGVAGDSFIYSGTVPGGAVLTVSCRDWEVTATGMTPNPGAITPTGPRFLTIPAARPGVTPRVQLTGTGGGGTTQLEVLGHRTYLC